MQKRRFLILVFAVSLFAFFLVIQLQKSGTPETPAVSAFSFSDDFSLQRGVHTVAVPRIATFTDRSVPHTLVAAQEALEKKYPAHFLSAGTRETTSRQLVAAEPASDGGTLQEPLGEIMEGWYATGPLDEYVKYSPSSFTQEQDGSGSQMVSAQKAGVGITRHFEGLDPNKYYQAKAWVYVVQGGVKLSAGKDGIPLSSTEGKWQLLTAASFTGEDTIDLSFSTYMPDTAAFIDNTTIFEVPAPVIPKEPEGDTLQQEGEGVTMEDDCPDCGTPEDLQNLAEYYYYQSHPNEAPDGRYPEPPNFPDYTNIQPVIYVSNDAGDSYLNLSGEIQDLQQDVRSWYSGQINSFYSSIQPVIYYRDPFSIIDCQTTNPETYCQSQLRDNAMNWVSQNSNNETLFFVYTPEVSINSVGYIGTLVHAGNYHYFIHITREGIPQIGYLDYNKVFISAHELGHFFGLVHSFDPSVMSYGMIAQFGFGILFDTDLFPEKYIACNSSMNIGNSDCSVYNNTLGPVSMNLTLNAEFRCYDGHDINYFPLDLILNGYDFSTPIPIDTITLNSSNVQYTRDFRVDGYMYSFTHSNYSYTPKFYVFRVHDNSVDICDMGGLNCQNINNATLDTVPNEFCSSTPPPTNTPTPSLTPTITPTRTPTPFLTYTPTPTRTPTPTTGAPPQSTPVPTRTPTPPPSCIPNNTCASTTNVCCSNHSVYDSTCTGYPYKCQPQPTATPTPTSAPACIPNGQCKTSSGTCCSGFSNPAPECTSSSGSPNRCAAAPTNTPTPTAAATRTPTPTTRPPTATPTSVTNVVCTQNYGSTASCVGQSQCFSYGDYWHFSDPNNHYCTEWGAGDGCCHCRTGNRTTEGNMSGQVINNMCDWRCNPGSCQPPPTTCSGGTISNVSIGNGILYGSGAPPANSLQLSWNWQKTSGVDPVRFKISRYMDLFNSCDVNMSCSATTQNSIDFATVNFNGNSYAYTDSIGLPAKMGVLNSYHVKAEYPSGTQVCGDIPPSGNLQLSNKQFTNPHGTVVVDPNNRCRIYGWTRDQDADLIAGVKQQLIVHFYEGQSYLGGAVATVNRDQYLWGYDVNMGDIKPSLRDGQDHQIYVWALNVKQPNYTFTTAGVNSKLNATAVTIRCPVQQSPTPTPTLIPVSCANPNITPSASLPVGGNIVYQSTSHTVGWTPIVKYKTIPNPQTTPTAPFNTCSGGLPCTYTPVAQVGEYVFSGVNLQKNIGGITYICSWSGQWSPSAPPGYSTCTNTCGRSLPVGSAPTATNTPTRTPTPTLINVSCTNPSTIPAAVLTPGQSITYQSAQYTNGWTPSVKYQRLPAGILTPTPTLGWQTCPSITPGVGIPCRYTPNITPGKNYIHVVNLQKTISVTPYVCGWNNTWSPQTPPGYGACTNNCEKVVQTNP